MSTTVGLDVHARSVVAEAVDWSTGQLFSRRLVPDNAEVLGWVATLPGPVAVTYEAGPTGFGLARAFTAAGIRCAVVAPSKLERPPGDRVKPTGEMLGGWRGCCTSGSLAASGSRAWWRKTPGTWSGPVKRPGRT